MSKGFFHATSLSLIEAPPSRVPKCGACGLFKTCKSPKMTPTGSGKKKILIVAEAPGKEEDDRGIQLVGNSGKELMKVLAKFGIDMRRDCYLTNTLICRPPDNATPTNKQISYCRPNLIKTIEDLNPKVIILMGGPAIKSLIGYIWKEEVSKGGGKKTPVKSVGQWVGWQIPCHKFKAWVCPTFHPSFLLRAKNPVVDQMFADHLEAAVNIESRPNIKSFEDKVWRIYNPEEAAAAIRSLMKTPDRPMAFDYETNCLKPDHLDARIVSCSISDGETTISYPMIGEAIKQTRLFLRSPIPKIASNLKFEERWSRRILKTRVRNWLLDTMLASHVLDNRQGITSIKFQAFIRLGVEGYDKHLAPYLKSKKGSHLNRIGEIDLGQLLLYGGLDSLLEWEVAMQQIPELEEE